jgi:outer membrane biosynthesis protein TonB
MLPKKEDKKSKNAGMTGTLFFHGALLLILLWIKLTSPVLPPEEEGILINFGTSDQGTGEIQPSTPTNANSPAESKSEVLKEPEVSKPEPVKPQPNLTQNVEDAPKIVKEKPKVKPEETPKPTPKPVEQPKKPEDPKPDPRALYPGKKEQKGQGTPGSEGVTGKPGDQGNPDGSPDSKSHTGTGKGDSGISFDLAGRSMTRRPTINDDSQEFGRVVIEVIVDKEGNVVTANGPARGSTTQATVLVNKAKQAAREARFSKSPSGVEEQRGTITFVFSPQ